MTAFSEELHLLCSIGLRTLVEALCTEQRMPGVNVKEKIKTLQLKGLISAAELALLNKLRLSGKVSAKKIKTLPAEKLERAIQLVNHILKSIYILPARNEKNGL
jgi:hypothetical protein